MSLKTKREMEGSIVFEGIASGDDRKNEVAPTEDYFLGHSTRAGARNRPCQNTDKQGCREAARSRSRQDAARATRLARSDTPDAGDEQKHSRGEDQQIAQTRSEHE